LPRSRFNPRIFAATALAFALAGCSSGMFDKNEGGFFSKPIDMFAKPDWARPVDAKQPDMDTGGPVSPEDLVGADGRCSAAAAQASAPPAAAPPTETAVGGMAGELRGQPAPPAPAAADPSIPPVLGGIALGMTECQAAQRAGLASNVSIGAGDRGERRVVLTYLSGPWPGIYRFDDGRLKEIDRAPVPPAPPKAPPKKKTTTKKPANAKTSQRETEQVQ